MSNQKLTKTGQWLWRQGEVSYHKFQTQFNRQEKIDHLNFLDSLKKEELSTNDWYILRNYSELIGIMNYFTNEERPGQYFVEEEIKNVIDKVVELEDLQWEKQDVEEILDIHFHPYFKNWKNQLVVFGVDIFLSKLKTNFNFHPGLTKLIIEYSKMEPSTEGPEGNNGTNILDEITPSSPSSAQPLLPQN